MPRSRRHRKNQMAFTVDINPAPVDDANGAVDTATRSTSPRPSLIRHPVDQLFGDMDVERLMELREWIGSSPHRAEVIVDGDHILLGALPQ